MKEHSKVADVQKPACIVLYKLSVYNDINRIETAAKGGILAILAAIASQGCGGSRTRMRGAKESVEV